MRRHLGIDAAARLEKVFTTIRGGVDKILDPANDYVQTSLDDTEYWEKQQGGSRELWRYPTGACGPIRNTGLDILLYALDKRRRDGKRYTDNGHVVTDIAAFLEAGGIIKACYGIFQNDDQLFFQNMIQLGNYVVDIAGDTGPDDCPPVLITPVEEGKYRNIDCWHDWANVVKQYWKTDIWTNTFVPILYPMFPFFGVSDGNLVTPHWYALTYKSAVNGFQDLIDLVKSEAYTSIEDQAQSKINKVHRAFKSKWRGGKTDVLRFISHLRKTDFTSQSEVTRFCEREEKISQTFANRVFDIS